MRLPHFRFTVTRHRSGSSPHAMPEHHRQRPDYLDLRDITEIAQQVDQDAGIEDESHVHPIANRHEAITSLGSAIGDDRQDPTQQPDGDEL